MVTILEAPFVTTLAHIVLSMRSRPQTPMETQLVSVYTKMPREMDKIFVKQPIDPRGRGLDPLGPPGPP
jgi:hypothetical protein